MGAEEAQSLCSSTSDGFSQPASVRPVKSCQLVLFGKAGVEVQKSAHVQAQLHHRAGILSEFCKVRSSHTFTRGIVGFNYKVN